MFPCCFDHYSGTLVVPKKKTSILNALLEASRDLSLVLWANNYLWIESEIGKGSRNTEVIGLGDAGSVGPILTIITKTGKAKGSVHIFLFRMH